MSRTPTLAPNLAIALVIAAATYTAVLCFLNTRVIGISNVHVAVADGAILLAASALAAHRAARWFWTLLAALTANVLLLSLVTGEFDAKAVRDPLVLITFVALGWRYGGFERARSAFFIVSAIVLVFAAFEYLTPDTYTTFFNVIRFYAARGIVDAEAIRNLDSQFFLSGARDGERMLAPFLGAHRVSSIFLEPVSMGNFGALALIFALSLEGAHWRTALAIGAVALITIVLADARFASMAAILFVVVRLLPVHWMRIGLPMLPLVGIALLIGFALSDVGRGDDMPTRLAGAGRVLMDMSPPAFFGLSSYEIATVDSGYAYAFSALGLPFCIALWTAFVLLPAPNVEAQRYKMLLGVYIAALLCISGTSLFALKTAGLGFFILGALAAPRTAPARFARRALARRSAEGAPA